MSWQAMDFSEHIDNESNATANKHWRDEAEYSRYVTPLLVRLQSLEWSIVLARQSARWHWKALRAIRTPTLLYDYCPSAPSHQEVITAIESRNLGKERWISSYYNPRTGECRRIQRYPLLYIPATKDKRNAGTHPVRFYPPEGPPAEDGFWFRLDDLKSPGWTPEAPAWHIYKTYKEKVGKWLVRRDTLQRNGPNRRQDLADRLRSISQELGYIREDSQDANRTLVKGFYKLKIELKGALTIDDKTGELYKVDPATLGKFEAKLEHFQRCLREFHEAEKPAPTAPPETAHPAEAPAGNPAPMPPLAGPMEVPDKSEAGLSPADLILGTGFTLDEADRLAYAVGLINEDGNYCLGPRKLGAIVGFVLALQQAKKLNGAIPTLTAVLAPRWKIQVATRKTGTKVADKYFRLTNKALDSLRKTD